MSPLRSTFSSASYRGYFPGIVAAAAPSFTGFGTKYTDPAVQPTGFGQKVAFNKTDPNSSISIGHTNSPYVTAWSWSNASGFGSKYANPTVLPGTTTSTAYAAKWASTNAALVVSQSISPWVS